MYVCMYVRVCVYIIYNAKLFRQQQLCNIYLLIH